MSATLKSSEIIFPQLLSVESKNGHIEFLVTAADEVIKQMNGLTWDSPCEIKTGLSVVSVTCTGVPSFEIHNRIVATVTAQKIKPFKIQTSAMTVSIFVEEKEKEPLIRALHDELNRAN